MFKVNNRQMGENSPNLVTLSGNRLNRLSSMADKTHSNPATYSGRFIKLY
jgi:hypothetical protein